MDKELSSAINFPSSFTEEQLNYISENIVDAARKICGDKLRNVILYGSYARGDFKEWSDVDIMVLADVEDADERRYEHEFINALYELNHHMNLLLSVLVTPYGRFERLKNDNPYYRNIVREGRQLC